ncbi:hypothetical protein [Aerosakkonema funiforme]|uniref:Uncharacterized protein n=1 Tax=Aerosakkonema funiforme FACHB-1375 TaxID=2949571 RepID=A0A926VI66_9CYAN|nr:hypothetical protein [Aerosakkonema funiforme]MBD2184234.1 hypothetical protein [Aerosakkonema funiforme FACHB-1375]
MTNDYGTPNNDLLKTSNSQIQKYNNNPAIQLIRNTAKLSESIKTAYSDEVTKSIAIRTEFEIWLEYDRNKS